MSDDCPYCRAALARGFCPVFNADLHEGQGLMALQCAALDEFHRAGHVIPAGCQTMTFRRRTRQELARRLIEDTESLYRALWP